MVRLIDVARAAGVSQGTASNTFNNPEIVRPALRARVEAAAKALGYVGPDLRGTLLRKGKFNAIAVRPPSQWNIADTLRNPVFTKFMLGVGEVCDEYGADLVVSSGRLDGSGGTKALVDGMIFLRVEHLTEVEPARLRRMPVTVMDFDAGPDVNSVRVDARLGAYTAAKHLLDLGHRRFGIISFLRDPGAAQVFASGVERPATAAGTLIDQDKYCGYSDALQEEGIDIGSVPMVQAEVYDATAAGHLLDICPDATAILSMSVMQAIAVIAEARRRGISVPHDLSVVGFNDIDAAATCDPPLTTVDGLTKERGALAARMLFEEGSAPARHEILTPHLILRSSTARASD
jgi:DNA-binding LacI/PurR family transcriptional regulator